MGVYTPRSSIYVGIFHNKNHLATSMGVPPIYGNPDSNTQKSWIPAFMLDVFRELLSLSCMQGILEGSG